MHPAWVFRGIHSSWFPEARVKGSRDLLTKDGEKRQPSERPGFQLQLCTQGCITFTKSHCLPVPQFPYLYQGGITSPAGSFQLQHSVLPIASSLSLALTGLISCFSPEPMLWRLHKRKAAREAPERESKKATGECPLFQSVHESTLLCL